MRQGIVFTACFLLTFNLALIAGLKSVQHEPERAGEEEMVSNSETGKRVESQVHEIIAERMNLTQEHCETAERGISRQQGEMNEESASSVQAPESGENTDLGRKMGTEFSVEGTSAIDKSVVDYNNLYKKWEKPKQVLGALTNIIKRYAETEGLEASSQQLFADLNVYSKQLNKEVKVLTKKQVNLDSYKGEEAQAPEFLKDRKSFFSPFNASDMYMNLLHSYYGALKNQNAFLNSVNQKSVHDPQADNFIIDGNKILAEDENYQKLKKIIDALHKIYAEIK